jgi:hypothetical protein
MYSFYEFLKLITSIEDLNKIEDINCAAEAFPTIFYLYGIDTDDGSGTTCKCKDFFKCIVNHTDFLKIGVVI